MKSRYNLFNYIELLVRSFIFLFIINSFWFISSTKLCFQASTIVSEWTKYSRGEVKFESIIQIKIVDAVIEALELSSWPSIYGKKKSSLCRHDNEPRLLHDIPNLLQVVTFSSSYQSINQSLLIIWSYISWV